MSYWLVKSFEVATSRTSATLHVTAERDSNTQTFSRAFDEPQYLFPILDILQDKHGSMLAQAPDEPLRPETGSLQFLSPTVVISPPPPLTQLHAVRSFGRWWRIRDDRHYEGRIQVAYNNTGEECGNTHLEQLYNGANGDPLAWIHVVQFLRTHLDQVITISGLRDWTTPVGNDMAQLSVRIGAATLSVDFTSAKLTSS